MHGVTQNTLTRPQHGDLQVASDDADTLDDDVPSLVFDRDDFVDVGNKRAFLLTGDLVELMYVLYLYLLLVLSSTLPTVGWSAERVYNRLSGFLLPLWFLFSICGDWPQNKFFLSIFAQPIRNRIFLD